MTGVRVPIRPRTALRLGLRLPSPRRLSWQPLRGMTVAEFQEAARRFTDAMDAAGRGAAQWQLPDFYHRVLSDVREIERSLPVRRRRRWWSW